MSAAAIPIASARPTIPLSGTSGLPTGGGGGRPWIMFVTSAIASGDFGVADGVEPSRETGFVPGKMSRVDRAGRFVEGERDTGRPGVAGREKRDGVGHCGRLERLLENSQRLVGLCASGGIGKA